MDSSEKTLDFSSETEQIGSLFREVREKNNLTINDVSLSLKISRRFLYEIEKGQWNELPGMSYIIGFVRSYGRFLKIDSQKFEKIFESITSLTPDIPITPPVIERIYKKSWKKISLVFSSLLVFGLFIFYLFYWFPKSKESLEDFISLLKDSEKISKNN
ncbi:MAG: helix-turn-helix domain-containing protein [Alphaproteobacteria bacterium]